MNAPAPKTPARGAPAAGLAASLAASLAAGLRRLRARLARPARVSPAPPRRAQGVLAVLIAMFVLSGGVRLYLGLDAARALGGADGAGAQAADGAAAETAGCAPPPAEVARALSAREDALVAAELRMAEREAALALGEEVLGARIADLVAAEERLAATIARVDGAAEADLARLTAVYENMKPKEAALLFEEMAPDFAAGFLARMRPDAAAGILAGMSSEAAYSASVLLAGRNALAPRD
jgi:flagellar motility protein MotE (MotC chaperone)